MITPTRGFVTCATNKYHRLVVNLRESLQWFSKYPLHVIYFESMPDSAGETDILDTTPVSLEWFVKMRLKTVAAMQSPFEQTIFVDADTVATPRVDDLFALFGQFDGRYPLMQKHHTFLHDTVPFIKHWGWETRFPFPQGASYMYEWPKSKVFFEEVTELYRKSDDEGIEVPSADEGAMQAISCKYAVKHIAKIYSPCIWNIPDLQEGRMEKFVGSYNLFNGCKMTREDGLDDWTKMRDVIKDKLPPSPEPIIERVRVLLV